MKRELSVFLRSLGIAAVAAALPLSAHATTPFTPPATDLTPLFGTSTEGNNVKVQIGLSSDTGPHAGLDLSTPINPILSNSGTTFDLVTQGRVNGIARDDNYLNTFNSAHPGSDADLAFSISVFNIHNNTTTSSVFHLLVDLDLAAGGKFAFQEISEHNTCVGPCTVDPKGIENNELRDDFIFTSAADPPITTAIFVLNPDGPLGDNGEPTFFGTPIALSQTQSVPEPHTLLLFGGALAGLGLIRRRHRNG